MSRDISQLSDRLESLDWGDCLHVECDKSFTLEDDMVPCCLCDINLKTSNSKNHILIGSCAPDRISRVHYLCYNCKRHCNLC